MVVRRTPALPRDPLGRIGRRLFRARRAGPRARGPRPRRDDGGLRARRARSCAASTRSRTSSPTRSPRATPGEVVVEALDDGDAIEPKEIVLRITARYRAFGLYETALLGMLAQSTGWATAAQRVRRRRGAAAGDLVRGAPRPPGHHRRPRLRGDRRRLRGRVDAGRRAPRRPEPDRHDAPLAGPDHRRHGRRRRGVRSRPRPRRAPDRPRRHVQGRGRGGAARRARPRRSPVRHPARHADASAAA